LGAERELGQWLISAVGDGSGVCPDRGKRSSRRHGWHERHLQDLPAQGSTVTVKLRLRRWRCRNGARKRKTFFEQLPEIAAPRARRTIRAAELVYLFGHGVGGRPGERLMKRIGPILSVIMGGPQPHCRRRGRSRMLQDQPRHQDLSAGRCPNNRGRLFTLPAQNNETRLSATK